MLPTYKVLVGDCLARLKDIPDNSIHCCVTSPPYYGLRSYDTETQIWGGDPSCNHQWGQPIPQDSRHLWTPDQCGKETTVSTAGGYPKERGVFCKKCGAWFGDLGLEPSPEMYIDHLVAVFREVRRVLRSDATLWLNIGDSYWGGGSTTAASQDTRNYAAKSTLSSLPSEGACERPIKPKKHSSIKPKDLIGIPWMLAFALRTDGWYLRQDIIWSKGNPMPESVTDRCTKSHEYIFLLTKSARYFWDKGAVVEPHSDSSWASKLRSNSQSERQGPKSDYSSTTHNQAFIRGSHRPDGGRNARSVWTITTQPYGGAHFATFPIKLPLRCIKAGTSEKGCCPTCGKPWTRVVEKAIINTAGWGKATKDHHALVQSADAIIRNNQGRAGDSIQNTIGWKPSCECPEHEPIPCTVLDPFFGAGTTALAAWEQGQSCIGVELNPEYAELARKRFAERVGIVGLMGDIALDVVEWDPPGYDS